MNLLYPVIYVPTKEDQIRILREFHQCGLYWSSNTIDKDIRDFLTYTSVETEYIGRTNQNTIMNYGEDGALLQ